MSWLFLALTQGPSWVSLLKLARDLASRMRTAAHLSQLLSCQLGL
jgi:hypothetical protein